MLAQKLHHQWILLLFEELLLLLLEFLEMLLKMLSQIVFFFFAQEGWFKLLRVQVVLSRVITQHYAILLKDAVSMIEEAGGLIVGAEELFILFGCIILIKQLVLEGVLVVQVRVQKGLRENALLVLMDRREVIFILSTLFRFFVLPIFPVVVLMLMSSQMKHGIFFEISLKQSLLDQ